MKLAKIIAKFPNLKNLINARYSGKLYKKIIETELTKICTDFNVQTRLYNFICECVSGNTS